MRGASFRSVLFAVLLVMSTLRSGQAQQSALPANWQQLSPTDFATLVQGYFQQGTFQSLSPTDQASLAIQGSLLFSQVDFSNTTLSYPTLLTLQAVGHSQLDQYSVAQARSALLARTENWTGKPYSEMRAKVMLLRRLHLPDSASIMQARNWVLAGGTAAQVPQTDLVYDFVRQMFSDLKVIEGSYSVTLAGQITAPQTGDYTFSISPIDVNMGFSNPSASVSMTVSVAGQPIINAKPPALPDPKVLLGAQSIPAPTSNWVSQSNPITLTAGTPVNVQATVTVDAARTLPAGVLHATLSWQGPGITTTLVPASAYTQAQNGTPGLQATYAWTANGQQQTLTRTEPMIDFSWTNSAIILAQDPTSANQSADAMWQAMTSADFVSSYAGATPVKLHPFLREPEEASCGLTTARRQAFLDLLMQNPTLLDAMNAGHAIDFFQAFRVGTPDKALNVVGTWATRQADLTCQLSGQRSFDQEMRTSLAGLAMLTTHQLPTQVTTLEQQFLQLSDGRCSLPGAYALAYSYLGRGKLADWIATLDAKLADQTVTGDQRVNWLLARAQAEEFNGGPTPQYPFGALYPSSSTLAGQTYLYQAVNAAQTPSVKVRAAKEVAARLTASGDLQGAKDFLTQVSNGLPDDQKAIVTTWQQQVDGMATAQTQIAQAVRAAANKSYVRTLQARRDQAEQSGDSEAASRYDGLISAASNQQ